MSRLSQFLEARTARERVLLALLGLIGLPLAFLVVVALPLLEARRTARAELAEAEALHSWYAARQAEIAALPAGTRPVEPAGLGAIEAALGEVALRAGLDRLSPTQTGGVEAAFSDVPFGAMMAWLDHDLPVLGYRLTALTLVRAGEGRVGALVRIEPAP